MRQSKPFSLKEMLTRGLIAGLIITVITASAPIAGSRWAGILSSFPSTLYALLVIVHYEAGNDLYPAIIFNFGRSVTALAVFYLGCWVILPMFGLNLGFVIVYCISALYLYGLHRLEGAEEKNKERDDNLTDGPIKQVAAAIILQEGKVLIAQRAAKDKLALKMGVPRGQIGERRDAGRVVWRGRSMKN